MNLLIKNGRVIDPVNGVDGVLDILISEGTIAQLGMQKHRNEWTKDEDLRFQLQSDLEEYYGNDDKRDSYENFYNETKGVFGKWHWYEECLSLAKAMDSGQLNKARKEMFARKREFDRRILNIFIEDMEEGYISEYSQRNFILFGDKKFGKLLHKKTMQQMTFFANEKISRNYKYFKELRDWCYEVETSGKAITAKEQAELEETKKLLTKYIKHANIFTNLNMSDYDIQELPQKSVELNSDGNADENNALQ